MRDRYAAPALGEHTSDTDTVVQARADDADPDIHRISCLAAYTVGLSCTHADDQACVQKLRDIDASADELRGAHGMLAGWDMTDTAHRRRALCLIERTLGDAEDDSPRRSTPQDHQWVTEWSL